MKALKVSILFLINIYVSVEVEAQVQFPLVIEAEDMEIKSGGVASDEGWLFDSNGVTSTTVDFPVDGYYSFEVRSKGVKSNREWPFMEVRIDDCVCGPVVIDNSQWRQYKVFSEVTSGSHQLSLAYVNNQGSRKLYLDKVEINITVMEDKYWLVKQADAILAKRPYPETYSITNWLLQELLRGIGYAYEVTGDDRYLEFVRLRLDSHVDDDGNMDVKIEGSVPGINLIWFYSQTGEMKYLMAAQKLGENWLDNYPRLSEGTFAQRRYSEQCW